MVSNVGAQFIILFAKLTISQVALQCLQRARSISLIQINAYQVNMLELET